jgi:hypothetical protein
MGFCMGSALNPKRGFLARADTLAFNQHARVLSVAMPSALARLAMGSEVTFLQAALFLYGSCLMNKSDLQEMTLRLYGPRLGAAGGPALVPAAAGHHRLALGFGPDRGRGHGRVRRWFGSVMSDP